MPTGADGSASKEPKRQNKPLQGSAGTRPHHADAHHDPPGSWRQRLRARALPLLGQAGQKVVAGRARFVEACSFRGSVDADAGCLKQDFRGIVDAGARPGERDGRPGAGRAQLELASRGPALLPDACAAQVDQCSGTLQGFLPWARGVAVPLHHLGNRAGLGLSGQHHDLVSGAGQTGRQRSANQAAAAGDHDFHQPSTNAFRSWGYRP